MSRQPLEPVFTPGEVILGKYRVQRVLGAGGMGTVLEAENLRTSRTVAIKVLSSEDDPRATTATRRFVNEARAAARLTHPNSVDVLDLETAGGSLFIVQEFLAGESLHERLRRERRMPWREALEVMIPVMSALAEAHRRGIVHRDVKPENIFLAEAAPGVMVPKIIDFGIARLAEVDLRLTRADVVMGTPQYMSPEQAAGERALDGQTDVWAVGVVLYEAIVGVLPFDGDNLEAVMRAIVDGSFTSLRVRDPSLPLTVAEAIERAIVRDRAARFATMQDFVDAAIACLGESPVGVGRIRATVAPKAAAVTDGAARWPRWRSVGTAVAWLATAGCGVLAGAWVTAALRPMAVATEARTLLRGTTDATVRAVASQDAAAAAQARVDAAGAGTADVAVVAPAGAGVQAAEAGAAEAGAGRHAGRHAGRRAHHGRRSRR